MGCSPGKRCSNSFIERLYVDYRVFILSVIARYIDAPSFQEDVFHDVILRILQKADLLSTFPRHKLETYILLMARGVSIDFLRKHHFNKRSDIVDEVIMNLVDEQRTSATGSMDAIGKLELAMMLESVSAEDLSLLIGKYYLGLDSKELANMSGLSAATVRSRIQRTKKKLLKQWKEAGLTMGDFLDG